jgi:hypothetical protein
MTGPQIVPISQELEKPQLDQTAKDERAAQAPYDFPLVRIECKLITCIFNRRQAVGEAGGERLNPALVREIGGLAILLLKEFSLDDDVYVG